MGASVSNGSVLMTSLGQRELSEPFHSQALNSVLELDSVSLVSHFR